MPKLTWRGGDFYKTLRNKYSDCLKNVKLSYRSLFYNEFTSCGTVCETLVEPLLWFMDHFARYLGPVFVFLVVCLTLSVVVIFYVCLLPHQYEQSLAWTIFHVLIGHYFLICITYHYFKASFTNPGNPPDQLDEAVSICKRCIGPKPARAHHCSVCKRCILKMDHHCPWLNNCVGHFNHRYFFLFCLYMWIGTVYVSAVAYPMFKEHFYGDEDPGPAGFFYPLYIARKAWQGKKVGSFTPRKRLQMDTTGLIFHTMIVYEFMLCSAVSIALSVLVIMQCRLISYGETSIEWHINKRETVRHRKNGQVYKNPYSFGVKENWYRFFGINKKGSVLTHVLLPSSHPPDEDGIHWMTSTYDRENRLLVL